MEILSQIYPEMIWDRIRDSRKSMSFDVTVIEASSADYPSALQNRRGRALFPHIWAIGNLKILQGRMLGLFCSVKCPGNIILRTYDLSRALRDAGAPVIGGFHSPIEKDCIDLLLHGTQPVIVCPARSIKNMRIANEHKQALEEGRLLFMSPFEQNQHRISAKTSQFRNLFVAALSEQVFVAHAEPGGKTENLCREILSWKKPIYTFNSDYNKNLIEMGVQPVNTGTGTSVNK